MNYWLLFLCTQKYTRANIAKEQMQQQENKRKRIRSNETIYICSGINAEVTKRLASTVVKKDRYCRRIEVFFFVFFFVLTLAAPCVPAGDCRVISLYYHLPPILMNRDLHCLTFSLLCLSAARLYTMLWVFFFLSLITCGYKAP